jgi:hypothetical protein
VSRRNTPASNLNQDSRVGGRSRVKVEIIESVLYTVTRPRGADRSAEAEVIAALLGPLMATRATAVSARRRLDHGRARLGVRLEPEGASKSRHLPGLSRWVGLLRIEGRALEDATLVKDDPFLVRFAVVPKVWLAARLRKDDPRRRR